MGRQVAHVGFGGRQIVSAVIPEAFVLLSLGIVYVGFCRLTHMSEKTTKRLVRVAFTALVISALANVFAVLSWGYVPQWPALVMAAAQVFVLLVSRRLWAGGKVPIEYQKQ